MCLPWKSMIVSLEIFLTSKDNDQTQGENIFVFLQRGKVKVAHDFSCLGDKVSENAVIARSTQSTIDRYFTAIPTADWLNCSSGSTVCITFVLSHILAFILNGRCIPFILICPINNVKIMQNSCHSKNIHYYYKANLLCMLAVTNLEWGFEVFNSICFINNVVVKVIQLVSHSTYSHLPELCFHKSWSALIEKVIES